jgi:hypothetical protein
LGPAPVLARRSAPANSPALKPEVRRGPLNSGARLAGCANSIAGDDPDGVRLRGLIVVLWRTGRRISEALASTESDLDAGRGTALGARRNAHATAPSGRSRQGAPPVGPASAAPSACREDVARGGVPLLVIQRPLEHSNLAITSVYLRGIDNTEIVHTVHERPAPTIPAHNGLQLH